MNSTNLKSLLNQNKASNLRSSYYMSNLCINSMSVWHVTSMYFNLYKGSYVGVVKKQEKNKRA